jgi:hypothetical protein
VRVAEVITRVITGMVDGWESRAATFKGGVIP